MSAAFVITLREGLEIALIIAIVLAYLRQTGRRSLFRPVWAGTAAAAVFCLAAGTLLFSLVGGLTGVTEQVVEGVLAVSAAGVLTWMIFWMRKRARNLGAELRAEVDDAASRSHRALATLAFVVVAREGLETVLFLLGAEAGGTHGLPIVVGGLLGLGAAAVLGALVYQGGHRVPIHRFFQVTGALLILFAAGLVGTGAHAFLELAGAEGGLAAPLWQIRHGLFADGFLAELLKTMFGWSPRPETLRVLVYFAYAVPIGFLYYVGGRVRPATARAVEA